MLYVNVNRKYCFKKGQFQTFWKWVEYIFCHITYHLFQAAIRLLKRFLIWRPATLKKPATHNLSDMYRWWLLEFYDSTRDIDDTTVGVGHSRRYCNTGYDQSQGRRPSTLKCIGSIPKGDIEPNHPSEINPNSDSRSRSDGRSRRFVQYRVDQSLRQRPRSLLFRFFQIFIYIHI